MMWAIGIYVGMGLVTLVAYGLDKRAAAHQRRRTPERTLHLLALLGGIAGALIAQQLFRHKRRKVTFMLTTLLIALLHAAGWTWWVMR